MTTKPVQQIADLLLDNGGVFREAEDILTAALLRVAPHVPRSVYSRLEMEVHHALYTAGEIGFVRGVQFMTSPAQFILYNDDTGDSSGIRSNDMDSVHESPVCPFNEASGTVQP